MTHFCCWNVFDAMCSIGLWSFLSCYSRPHCYVFLLWVIFVSASLISAVWQFGAYNFAMEANFCTLKTAVEPTRCIVLQGWKILWTVVPKRRLKVLQFSRSEYKSQLRPLVVRKIGRITKNENKLANLRWLCYCLSVLQKQFSCWDRFTSFEIDPNSCSDKICQFLRFFKNFLLQPPSNFHGKQSLWGAL